MLVSAKDNSSTCLVFK